MFIKITQVKKGDTIVDGRDKVEVTRVENDACSSLGTHINRRYCYDRSAYVEVRAAQKNARSEDFTESGVGDLEEDYHNLASRQVV